MSEFPKCEAPKVLGEPERCGKPFPARGVKKTCSPGCAHNLLLERKRRDNKKKAEKRPWLTCDTPGCEEQFPAYKSSKFCPKHRGDYYQPHHKEKRNLKALQVYWKDPEKARAKNNAKDKAQEKKTGRNGALRKKPSTIGPLRKTRRKSELNSTRAIEGDS